MASSSHDVVTKIKYDAFISFRGTDVRRGLLSHLIKELRREKIDAYVDYRLERGDEISSLFKEIEGSHVFLVIFSKDYASSKWCLDELVKMIQCVAGRTNKQILIPVFYNVEPSHVQNQEESYGAAFAKHEKKQDMLKVQQWRFALKMAAQFSGLHYPLNFENESDLVDEIVKGVSNQLNKFCSSDSDHPSRTNGLVGIDQNIAWIKSMLTTESREVLMLGIWGMGGLGKTTIARVVFDAFSRQYNGCCFLENIRDQLKSHQSSYLRDKLVSKLLEEENPHINGRGKSNSSKRRLSRMKVLIVLDDVNTPKDLKDLLEPICFGPGSSVIVTSRDMQVFTAGEFNGIHKVKELNFEESLKLFCINAFNENQPKMGYEELSKKAVAIAKGVPLALKVFGLYFCRKSKDTWECALEKFKKYPNGDIQRVLRLSYDGLDPLEKNIFLDIAFFFKEENKGYVIRQLDAWGFHGASGIQSLQEKALISISSDNGIQMHDLIQEMGWEIVREQSIDPGRRSRLRDAKEVRDVLKNNKGTDIIVEGMVLDVTQIGEVALNVDSLKRMPNLRLLKLHSPLPVEVPMQIRYFVPEDFANMNFTRMDWEMQSTEARRWSHLRDNDDMDDVFKASKGTDAVNNMKILDTIIKMHIPRLMKLKSPMHVEHPMLSLPIVQDFVNVNGSGLDISKEFVKLQKLSKLPGVSKLLNYNQSDGVLILETNSMGGSKQLVPLPTLNIGSALKELASLGSDVHIKSLHHLFMNGCSVSKNVSMLTKEIRPLNSLNSSIDLLSNLECSDTEGADVEPKKLPVLPNEMRQLNFTDTRMELLNSSAGHFSSLECSDIDCLQLETLPNEFHVLRSTYYHKLSNCSHQDSGKPKLLVLFDGFRYSEQMSFFILRELKGKWSYLWSLSNYQWLTLSRSLGLTNWGLKYWLGTLVLDGSNLISLPRSINHLLLLKILSLRGCWIIPHIQELPPFLEELHVDHRVFLETLKFNSRALAQGYKSRRQNNFPSITACYPGSKVPEWFTYCMLGDSINIELAPSSNDLFSFILSCSVSLHLPLNSPSSMPILL